MEPRINTLLAPKSQQVVDLARVFFPTVHRRAINPKKQIMLQWRQQTAVEAIAGLDHETELYGYTKGQYSCLDLLRALLAKTGPADLSLSTWTASKSDCIALAGMKDQGIISSARILLDVSFSRRDPESAALLRAAFGPECLRLCLVHDKFVLVKSPGWNLVLKTSMNLNFNKRLESWTISNDAPLFSFVTEMLNQIWKAMPSDLVGRRPWDVHVAFRKELQ